MGIRQIGGSGTDVSAIYIDQFEFTIVAEEATPWLTGWGKRIAITVNTVGLGLDADVSHFPLPIFLSASAGMNNDDVTAIFDEIGANSKKIAVTKSDATTQMYVEIEKWDDIAESGVVWVSKSDWTVSSGTDDTLYIYYDSTKIDNTTYVGDIGDASSQNIWNSNFKGVWHLGESSGNYIDSTGTVDAVPIGTLPTQVPGIIGDAQDLEASTGSDRIKLGASNVYIVDNSQPLTLSLWTKPETIPVGNIRLATFHTGSGASSGIILTVGDTNRIRINIIGVMGGYENWWDTTITTGNWYNIALTWDGTDWRPYLAGVQDGSTQTYGIITAGSREAMLGGYDKDSGSAIYDGILEEYHISNVARSAAWIKFNNRTQLDNVLSYGSEETL